MYLAYHALFINTTVILSLAATPEKKQTQLRSSNSDPCFTPGVKTNIGSMSLSVAGPTQNSDLGNLKSADSLLRFRHHLKTRLFD